MMDMDKTLTVKIGKLVLKNPVMVASGTFGYAEEFKDFISLKQLGAIVTKTITVKPRFGNIPPRTCETPAGMLNSIGLENPGLTLFIKEKLPVLFRIGVPVIVSVASEGDMQEFMAIVKRLEKIPKVAAIELNISCPNLREHREKGDRLIAQDAVQTYDLVRAVRKCTSKTLITKLSPNVTDITEIAVAAQRAGSDALALINTLGGMSIDVAARKPKIAMISGGLSGPAIRPVAVKMVWETYQKVSIPLIGMGGIIDTQSALEFILAGATAVSVGTANFTNPKATIEIIDGLRSYAAENRIRAIKELIGGLLL
jgi:dihydroorotate dehydrogenase (NAD+) catalytic subunit